MSAVPGIKPRRIPPPLSTRKAYNVAPSIRGIRPLPEDARIPLRQADAAICSRT